MADKRLGIKELARALGYHRDYIAAMRRAGFIMPGRKATIKDARAWLKEHKGWFSQRTARDCFLPIYMQENREDVVHSNKWRYRK